MLKLKRSRGQAILIKAPAGQVAIRVLSANAHLQETTLEVVCPPDWQPVDLQRLASGEHLTIPTPDGSFEVTVLDFDIGPAAHQHAMSVQLGIDAPRDWTVLREELDRQGG